MENNSGANLRKEKDIVRGDIGVYVIPALRNKRMNNLQISSEEISTKPENKDDDKKMFSDELNDNSSSDAQSTSLHGTSESIKSSPPHHSLNDSLKNLTLQDNSLSLSSEDYLSCCLLISGFDPSLQPEVKENLLKQFYNYGGKSQWFRSLDAEIVIFAFSSNQKASLAYQQSKLRPPLRVVFLNEYDERNSFKLEVDEGKTSIKILSYSLAAKELVGSFKPEIDSRVANRMISAALGIRRTSNTPKTQKTKPRKAPSPPRTDAWDD